MVEDDGVDGSGGAEGDVEVGDDGDVDGEWCWWIQELRGSKQICGGGSGGDGLVVVELGDVGVEQSQLEVELGLLWGRQAAVVVLHLVR
jgi:hypothetical protein